MAGLGKIDTSQIKNQVYDQCRNMIIQGKWPPGSKIPSENQLCEQLGVSRVSVRSALQSLSAQGFIEIRRGEGSFVNNYNLSEQLNLLMPLFALDKDDIMNVLEYRIIIEPNIMPLIVERITDEDLRKLESIYNEMKKYTEGCSEFAKLDEQFHFLLVDILSNKIVIKVYKVLFEIFNSAWLEIIETLGVQDGIYYHKLIIDALRERDADAAKALMHEHVQRTVTRMSDYFNGKT